MSIHGQPYPGTAAGQALSGAYPPATAPIERQATALDMLCSKLDGLIAQYGNVGNRLDQMCHRTMGPHPENPSKQSVAEPTSMIQLIDYKLHLFEENVDWLRTLVGRLEQVL